VGFFDRSIFDVVGPFLTSIRGAPYIFHFDMLVYTTSGLILLMLVNPNVNRIRLKGLYLQSVQGVISVYYTANYVRNFHVWFGP
jgi:hypothetical protein